MRLLRVSLVLFAALSPGCQGGLSVGREEEDVLERTAVDNLAQGDARVIGVLGMRNSTVAARGSSQREFSSRRPTVLWSFGRSIKRWRASMCCCALGPTPMAG